MGLVISALPTYTSTITSITILLSYCFDITISGEPGSPDYSSICKILITLPAIKCLANPVALNCDSWNERLFPECFPH